MSATVPAADDRALLPASHLVGASVIGVDGTAVGTITELMIASAPGSIVYAALSVGGIAGFGERMFAVPWSAFVIDPVAGALSVGFTRGDLDGESGFDKDAWPTVGDARLVRG